MIFTKENSFLTDVSQIKYNSKNISSVYTSDMVKLWGKSISVPSFNCIIVDSYNNYYKHLSSDFQNEKDLYFNTDKNITYTNGSDNFICKYSTSLFMVINKNVLQSTDGGLTWNYIYELPYLFPTGIAISDNGTIVIPMKSTFGLNNGYAFVSYSNDLGRTWNDIQVSETSFTNIGNIAYGNGTFVFISMDSGGHVFYSSNGRDWSVSYSGVINWSICYGHDKFVISGYCSKGKNNCYSSNGINWISSNTHGLPGVKMIYVNNKFYVFANSTSSTNYISISEDGVEWTYYKPNTPIITHEFSDIIYSELDKHFYCITYEHQILTSSNAIDWTSIYLINNLSRSGSKIFMC